MQGKIDKFSYDARWQQRSIWCDTQKLDYEVLEDVLNCINITGLMERTMKKWNVDLVVGNETLGNVRIWGGVFQGDSLTLLPILVLIPYNGHKKMNAGYEFRLDRNS